MMFVVAVIAHRFTYNFKIGVMFLITSGLTIILPFWAYIFYSPDKAKNQPSVGFAFSIINLLFFGITVSFLQASGFAFASVFPFKYIGALMVG